MTRRWRHALGAGFGTLALFVTACEGPDLSVPTESEAQAYFAGTSGVTVEISGNVVVVNVNQPFQQVRRGGSLWAKVGPYIYLFSDETERLFTDFRGLAGVRVITRTGASRERVATVLLARGALTGVTWRRAKNIAGRARLEGTKRPSLLEELVRWGEDHTEFEYSARYVPR